MGGWLKRGGRSACQKRGCQLKRRVVDLVGVTKEGEGCKNVDGCTHECYCVVLRRNLLHPDGPVNHYHQPFFADRRRGSLGLPFRKIAVSDKQ